MKTFIRRTAILGMATALTFNLVACGGGEERQAEYLSRAQEYLDAGNFDKARLDVKNALQINDNSAQGRYLMALVEEESSNWRGVVGNLTRAVELDPTHVDAQLKLAIIMLASNNMEEATRRVQLAYDLDAFNPEVLAVIAVVAGREQDLARAEEFALRALELNAGEESAIGVMVALRAKEKPEEALAIIDRGAAANPESVKILTYKMKVLESLGRTEEAIAVFKTLIADNPEDVSYVRGLAEYYVAKFRAEEAETLMRKAITSQPEQVEFKLLLIRLLIASHGAEAAMAELGVMVQADPGIFKLRDGLGELMRRNGDISGAEALYEEALEVDSDGADSQIARIRLAGLALAANSLDKARGWAEQALEIEPENPQALILRGRINLIDGKFDAAIPDLRMVLRSEPGSIPAILLLAEAQRSSGSVNLAQDNYRKVLELQPNNDVALYQSATIFSARREYEQAAVNLEKVLEQNPGNFQAINLLAGVYTNLELWDEAAAVTEILSGDAATSMAGAVMSAEVALRKGDFEKAINTANRAREENKEAFAPVSVIMRANAAKGDVDAAIDAGEAYRLEQPDVIGINSILARLYLAKQQPNKALTILEETIDLAPDSIQSYLLLARIHGQMGNLELREGALQKGAVANPSNIAMKIELGVHYQQTGRIEQARDLLEEAHRIDEKAQAVANNLSGLLIDHYPTEENLRRAQELTLDFDRSESPALLDTVGWLHYRLGNLSQAIKLLKTAQERGGQGAVYWYHLGMAYHKNGDAELAREQLGKALQVEGAEFFGKDEAEKAYNSL